MVEGVGRIEDLRKVGRGVREGIGTDTLRNPTRIKHENNHGVISFPKF